MSLISDLQQSPTPLPLSSRYTAANGLLYMASGALLLLWPQAIQVLFADPAFVGNEAALIRVVGMTLAIIGWFYCFGGRSGGRQVVAASVLDRITLVPVVLGSLAWAGVFPHTLGMFAILDPLLGLGAWWLLARER